MAKSWLILCNWKLGGRVAAPTRYAHLNSKIKHVNPSNSPPLTVADIPVVAAILADSFPRRFDSRECVSCNARSYPRMQYFVAESLDGDVIGYILWTEIIGFRHDAVFELEQLVVLPLHQRQGVGEALIRQSLCFVAEHLAARGSALCAVKATIHADNLVAQRLYIRVLGPEIVATIPSLFASEEVVMLAREIGCANGGVIKSN